MVNHHCFKEPLKPLNTAADLKELLVPFYPVLDTCCYLERSVYRDEDTLESLGLNTGAMLYFKDRGLQIGWTTVFLTEYAGPLFVYLWFYRSEGGQVPYIKLPVLLSLHQCYGSGSTGSTCFGPPGSGSISQMYGSGSGFFYHQAKE
jgi:hypothetical protein